MEAELVTLLRALCPRVHPDFAPGATAMPYVIYQAIGGEPLRYVDNTPASQRHTMMQISVWHTTRALALQLVRQIEEALCAPAAPFTAKPDSEPISEAVEDLTPPRYGCMQDYSIWSAR